MKYEQRKSGLVVPEQPPEPPPELVRSPLEFQMDYDRKEARRAINVLINLTRKHALMSDQLTPVRRQLVMDLSRLLVGEDACYEELC